MKLWSKTHEEVESIQSLISKTQLAGNGNLLARCALAWLFVIAAGAGLFGANAGAAPITAAVTGRIDSVDAGLSGFFFSGQSFTWTYTYESNTPDINPSPQFGTYRNGITNAVLELGGILFVAHTGIISALDNTVFDRLSITAPTPGGNALGPPVAGLFPYFVGVELTDATATALSSDVLPDGAPILADYDQRDFELAFAVEFNAILARGVQRVRGIVTEAHEIPLPSSALLVLLPLFSMLRRPRH